MRYKLHHAEEMFRVVFCLAQPAPSSSPRSAGCLGHHLRSPEGPIELGNYLTAEKYLELDLNETHAEYLQTSIGQNSWPLPDTSLRSWSRMI